MLELLTGREARTAVATRESDSSAVSGRHVITGPHSFHHRQLRSQGGPDTIDNLILLSGSGTTGEHGWVHASPARAKLLGLIVPSWARPADWPVYRRGPHNTAPAWFYQTPDGQLVGLSDGAATMAAITGVSPVLIADAVAAFGELAKTQRGDR